VSPVEGYIFVGWVLVTFGSDFHKGENVALSTNRYSADKMYNFHHLAHTQASCGTLEEHLNKVAIFKEDAIGGRHNCKHVAAMQVADNLTYTIKWDYASALAGAARVPNTYEVVDDILDALLVRIQAIKMAANYCPECSKGDAVASKVEELEKQSSELLRDAKIKIDAGVDALSG